MTVVEFNLAELEASIERTERGETLADEAVQLSGSLYEFIRASWHIVVPRAPFVGGPHIDAICDHLEAVSAGEIKRLVICVPPGTTKSTATSICWPAWEWATMPHRRFITASYVQRLSTRLAVKSRDLIRSSWYQARWGDVYAMKADEDLKTEFANDKGGRRLAIGVGTGTGEHGDVVLIDDPHDAEEVLSDSARAGAIEWHDGTITTRFTNHAEGAEVIIAQRLHERDLIGHVLDQEPEAWTVLCLPERYEARHPFRTPARVELPSGRTMRGDIREEEGELLCPDRIGERENTARILRLGAFRAAGQLQQRPSAREGAILKRQYWRWYPPQGRDEPDEVFVARLPKFTEIVQSWDTSFKDSSQSDKVGGTVWGKIGADLYLLPEGRNARLSLSGTKTAIRNCYDWAEERWPKLAQRVLVEKTANGPEVIAELKQDLRGIIPTRPSVSADRPSASKVIRAEAAEPALEAGNIYLPGYAEPSLPQGYDLARTPELAALLVEECAAFPFGANDDLVDSFTQAVNWTRVRPGASRARIGRPSGKLPRPGSLAGTRP